MHAFLSDCVGIFSRRSSANFLASPLTLCYTSLAVRGCSRYLKNVINVSLKFTRIPIRHTLGSIWLSESLDLFITWGRPCCFRMIGCGGSKGGSVFG